MTGDAPPMVTAAMGDAFGQRAPAVQAFHRLGGPVVLHGQVAVTAPAGRVARWLAICLGAPLRQGVGTICFELHATPQAETWVRHFPHRTMASRLERAGDTVVERLGAATLIFRLSAQQGRLCMALQRLRFLGVPCPQWLLPRLVAEATDVDGALHFNVSAGLPWLGTVVGYRGHLVLPAPPGRRP